MLGTLFIVLLFQSLYMRGTPFVLNAGIKVSPVDIILIIFFCFHLVNIFMGKTKIKLSYPLNCLLCFFCILSVVEIFSVIFIDKGQPGNVTLALSIIRNFILIYLIVNLVILKMKTILFIVVIAAINSIIALFFYIKTLSNIYIIMSRPDLWKPGIFYTLDQGVLRLQGLSDDPNFFFLVNFIGVVLNWSLFTLQKGIKKIIYFVLFILLLLTSVLTFSRTGFIIASLFFITLFCKYYRYVSILLPILIVLIAPFFNVLKLRFASAIETGGSGRLYLWNIALEGFIKSPIWGQGGRYTLKVANNYAHNDFLEILSSHGLIGIFPVIIMYIYIIFAFIKIFKKINGEYHGQFNTFFNNIFLAFLIYILAQFFFTIFYNPYIWFMLGMLIALKISAGKYYKEYYRDE